MSYMNLLEQDLDFRFYSMFVTLLGPGEDKNRKMTSMLETHIKLSYNGGWVGG